MTAAKHALGIPSFFLFGEEPRETVGNYLHMESIADRSRPLNWEIRPHSHANLGHVVHVSRGAGTMTAEDSQMAFRAPCMLLIPARLVHGFQFDPETVGVVITISSAYLNDITARMQLFARLFDTARAIPISQTSGVGYCAERLSRELVWIAAGHDIAVEASLTTILVECVRALEYSRTQEAPRPRAQTNLVANFRELIENNYRSTQNLTFYTAALGATATALRTACMRITGSPPAKLIQNRIVLEAKRALLYSNMSVKEIAHYLGFNDAAYFTRFFTKCTGQSPRAFRSNAVTQRNL